MLTASSNTFAYTITNTKASKICLFICFVF